MKTLKWTLVAASFLLLTPRLSLAGAPNKSDDSLPVADGRATAIAQQRQEKNAEAKAAKAKEEAAQKAAEAERPTTLSCWPVYQADWHKYQKLGGTEFGLSGFGEPDAGVTYDDDFFPTFKVDLGQMDRNEKNKADAVWRTIVLKGHDYGDNHKVLPMVDIVINPYWVGHDDKQGNFVNDNGGHMSGFSMRVGQVSRKKEDVPVEKRAGFFADPDIYVRSVEVSEELHKGDFSIHIDSFEEGVGYMEFKCSMK